MFQPFNNEQPCPERPTACTAPGVRVYYSDFVIRWDQEVKAVYATDGYSFDLRTAAFRWAGCVVNAISEVQQSSPEGFPHKGEYFCTTEGDYFLVVCGDDPKYKRFKDCLNGEECTYCTYRIVRNFVLGSEKIGHEIVSLTFNSSGEVIKAEVDASASAYRSVNSGNSVEVVNPPVDFTENIKEIEEISERLENLRAQIAGEESRYNKLREFFALADELGYSVVKKHQG